jgi:carboxypeptidase Q
LRCLGSDPVFALRGAALEETLQFGMRLLAWKRLGRMSVAGAMVVVFAAALIGAGQAGAPYEDTATMLLKKGLREQGAYQTLIRILSVGPRLTGSPQAEAAVELMTRHMKELGFENVRTEPTTVSHWVRGDREEGRILSRRFGNIRVPVRALGGSIATPKGGITAGVLEVKSFEELRQAGAGAKGKIIFFNGAMDPAFLDTFQAYGAAARQRSAGAAEAARAGGIAAVVRSLTLEINDDPHTGTMSYAPDAPKVPAVSLATRAADRLSEIVHADPEAQFRFRTSCRSLAPVATHNVMGEIRGTEKPEEVIVVGGHLDSWDLSPGAHDDGAGCAQAVEALRLIRGLSLKPKRTIRTVLFMDEENGGTGGEDYARSETRKAERHLAAVESDRGGFLPLGIGAGAKGEVFDRIKSWEPLFRIMGLQWIRPGGGGVDIGPLAASGAVLMSLVPDSQRYFEVHHSGMDVLEKVNSRELELGASALALLVYLLAQEGIG